MNIGLDARPLSKIKAGIGYYVYTLLKNLATKCPNDKFFLFSDKEILIDFDASNIIKVVDNKIRPLKGTLWYLVRVNYLVKKYNIDVFWGTQNVLPFIMKKNVKKMLTVHDLVCYKYPQTMEKLNYFINRILIPLSIKLADKIIAVSNSTKDDVLNYFKIPLNKVEVVYNPVNTIEVSKEREGEYLNSIKLQKNNYILYMGTIEPRKNISAILNICEDLYKETGLLTVLAGKIGWEREEVLQRIEKLSQEGYVKFLHYISEEEKAILMKNSFVFIFPSLYEGFGLPVVEALKYGTVVLVSDTSSLREIIKEKELRFPPEDCNLLKNKVIDLYTNEKLYSQYKEICRVLAQQFDDEEIITKYVNLIYGIKGVEM